MWQDTLVSAAGRQIFGPNRKLPMKSLGYQATITHNLRRRRRKGSGISPSPPPPRLFTPPTRATLRMLPISVPDPSVIFYFRLSGDTIPSYTTWGTDWTRRTAQHEACKTMCPFWNHLTQTYSMNSSLRDDQQHSWEIFTAWKRFLFMTKMYLTFYTLKWTKKHGFKLSLKFVYVLNHFHLCSTYNVRVLTAITYILFITPYWVNFTFTIFSIISIPSYSFRYLSSQNISQTYIILQDNLVSFCGQLSLSIFCFLCVRHFKRTLCNSLD